MTERGTYAGFSIRTSTVEEQRKAIMNGRFLHREAGMAFYEYQGNVYVVFADAPPADG
jgi:hypothetical protein